MGYSCLPMRPVKSMIGLLLPGLLCACTAPAGERTDLPVPMDLALPDLGHDEEDLGAILVTGPDRLSETGLYADFQARTLATGVRPYAPRYPLWSDGSDKERFLYLPPGASIDTSDMDNWVFPVGTKAWKHFRVGGRLVETRLFHKVREGGSGGWWRVAYVWNDQGTEAFARPEGVPNAAGTGHDVPTQKQCAECHVTASDSLLGVGAIQLSAPNGNGVLSQLGREGHLSAPPKSEFQAPGSGATQEALGYLHGNCGSCHNDRAVRIEKRRLTMELSVKDRMPEQSGVYRTTFHARLLHVEPEGQTQVLVPGHPEQSGMVFRMKQRSKEWQMPPLCTKVVDGAGVATIESWITSLGVR